MASRPVIQMRDRIRAYAGETRMVLLWLFRGLVRVLPFLRRPYHQLLAKLVQRTGLFDKNYYLEYNPDVAEQGVNPLRHYVMYGDREGRWPMALFDPDYYRSHIKSYTKGVNTLLHYCYVGRHRRISPSPWFDLDFYLKNNKDVARANVEPLFHFIMWGGMEGRSPNPSFDSAYYLQTYPDVHKARINPLLHYLIWGRLEGRRTAPDTEDDELASSGVNQPVVPDETSWSRLRPRSKVEAAEVDVIVPVYKGYTETLCCIYSVLNSASKTSFELIVIDDQSPEPELRDVLKSYASQGLFTLLHNERNQGFVATVNRGMALHPDRDVVLLNSDAEVYDGWLDRLRQVARSSANIGTVTPLSNNATICSYPRFLHDNPYPLEVSYAELDVLAAQTNKDIVIDAPTGVGFCFYIRRDCLNSVGYFDEKAFGKGYGEENDFCQRAIARGWRNVIAANTFVHHWGAASFQGMKAKRVQAAMEILARRHPGYERAVNAFIKADPLAEARRRLDWARLRRMCRERNVLIVCHSRGGGTERHVQEDIARLEAQGYGVFLLRPMRGQPTRGVLKHARVKPLPNMPSFELADLDAMIKVCRELGITDVHTHSLVDFAVQMPQWLAAIVQALGVRWEANLHDYKVICPRINLVDENGVYCGEPDVKECNLCLAKRGSDFTVTDIREWRHMHGEVLGHANEILVPDEDVASRLSRYFPKLNFTVSPHEQTDYPPVEIPVTEHGSTCRVVVIGAINKLKGYDVLLGCAEDARRRKLPLEFVLFGFSMNDQRLRAAGVHVTGRYQDSEAIALVQGLSPNFIFLPSLWPETYSYTLSIGLSVGRPVAAFDIGAIARRLRAAGRDQLLFPLSFASDYKKINDLFLAHQGVAHVADCLAAS